MQRDHFCGKTVGGDRVLRAFCILKPVCVQIEVLEQLDLEGSLLPHYVQKNQEVFDTAHFRLKTWPFQPWSNCFFEALDPAVATQWADGKSHASTLDKNRNAQLITSRARQCKILRA